MPFNVNARRQLTARSDRVKSVDLHPTKPWVLISLFNGQAHLWDFETQPLRLDVKRKLLSRSDRVKCVDLHPTEAWMLVSLYNGNVHIWNYDTQQHVKSFEVCDLPVRAAKFVPRKNWVITGSDDMQVRVFNYNTLERVHQFEAHSDYLRSIAVHPTQPYVLTCSDDMVVKLWDWDNKWTCKQIFEGHTHYVMQAVINPKDNNTFATASLDRSVKVWQLGSTQPNFTLEGHKKGVNCVDYYHGGDKPYLISGADDQLVKIWDYQNKTCVATLEGHASNISAVCFHPELPIIMTGSEDSTVRIWHANTYRLETTLNYGLERVWCIQAQRGNNSIGIGYDEGSVVIKLGREEPAVSMDSSGKIIWARHSEVQQANLKALGPDNDAKDGERLPLSVKDLGACEIYPQTISHNPNGRFVVVCGDGEYIIYTAMALRNKAYGSAQEFVWASDSSVYAVRETSSSIKIYKNFKETKTLKPDFGAEGIFGASMLGVRSATSLSFYDWETLRLIRRIEIVPKHVYWNESGELCCIATEESFFILRFDAEIVANTPENSDRISDDGIEDAFEVVGEVQEIVRTGLWVGDCFAYTTGVNRLNYYVGGEIVTIAHLDRTRYLLGYIAKDSRLYLCDKDLNVTSYELLLSVLEYQTAVMRKDFDTADKVLPTVPKDQRTRVAHFLDKQGFKQQALAVSMDPEHRFDLALQLGDLKIAYQLAVETDSEEKWKQLSRAATSKSELILAGECLGRAKDYGGLLLLASSAGSHHLMEKLSVETEQNNENNVAFVSNFMLGRVDKCVDILISTDRLPEAAFFARTYVPSRISEVVGLWKEKVSETNAKVAESLADPVKYENLFPGLDQSRKGEQYLKLLAQRPIPAAAFSQVPVNEKRDVLGEMVEAEAQGKFTYNPDAVMAPPLAVPLQATMPPALSPRFVTPPPVVQQISPAIPIPVEAPPMSPVKQRTPEPVVAPDEPDWGDDDEDEDDFKQALQAPDIATSSRAQPDLLPPAEDLGPDVAANAPKKPATQPALVQDSTGLNDFDNGGLDAELQRELDQLDLHDGGNVAVDTDDDLKFDDDDDEWTLGD